MLEEIQKLGDSVSTSQIRYLRNMLGDKLFVLLDFAFDAETEEEASERVDAFVSAAKKSPLKMLKARRILNKDQKAIIMEFLEED